MKSPSSLARRYQTNLASLVTLCAVLICAFLYLDVPIHNAILISLALVMQASLGMQVILGCLTRLRPSLLLLCGPGLILGGALSVGVFHLTGRGATGVAATTVVNLVAVVMTIGRTESTRDLPPMWTLIQVFGLAALALVVEFSELLPIAVLLFVWGGLSSPTRKISPWTHFAMAVATAIIVTLTLMLRQKFWWVVTDDYLYFEVLSKHITQAGLLTKWGMLDFSHYHWLSYAWSGLLNELGGVSSPFVTLTRVMPLVYSLSLSASLTLFRQQSSPQMLTRFGMLPVWVIISLADLDWSGTSTAGIYAVLAALMLILYRPHEDVPSTWKRKVLLGLIIGITALTKVPATFSALALVMVFAAETISNRLTRVLTRHISLFLGILTTVSVVAVLVWLSGPAGGWRLQLGGLHRELGQLSESSLRFAVIGLVLLRLPLWVLVLSVSTKSWPELKSPRSSRLPQLMASTALIVLGLLLEMSIFAYSNVFLYFAGPMYFLASIATIIHCSCQPEKSDGVAQIRVSAALSSVIVAYGLLWSQGGSRVFWSLAERALPSLSDLHVTLLQVTTSDSRTGATLAAAVIFIISIVTRRRVSIVQILLLPLVVLTLSNSVLTSVRDFRVDVPAEEIRMNLGEQDIQDIASRMRLLSKESELVATNHLYDSAGQALSDFSLAAWSGREFLILGPRFAGDLTGHKAEAVRYSMEFGASPSSDSCRYLWNNGVRWFVADLRVTPIRDWSICSSVAFSTEKFLLLSLSDSSLN